jgi:hypothetical protein
MAEIITPKTQDEFIETFTQTVAAEAEQEINTSPGSVVLAFGKASAINNMYLQSRNQQLALDSRLDTAEDDALDTWVEQYSPPFTKRLEATPATSAPVAPTTLLNSATSTFLRVASTVGLLVGQALKLINGSKSATTTITTIEPTTTLTVNATQGALVLNVVSTTGMFVNGVLTLTDGNYTVDATITSINSPTQVGIQALTSLVPHTYVTGTTVVKLKQVLQVAALTFVGGAVLGDFITGSSVRATSMLEGQRFYRNTAAPSSPSIQARNGLTAGYRVQTALEGIAYEVVPDLTNPNYDSLNFVYRIPANETEVYVAVEAVTAGTTQHVIANALTVLPTTLSGVDGTNNAYAIANATDKESNSALRARFKQFLQGVGNTGSRASIEAAVASVQAGVQYTVIENVAADGVTPQLGNFLIIVSDAFGALNNSLAVAVTAAVDAVRAITTTFSLKAPTIVQPSIAMTVTVDTALYDADTVRGQVQLAIYNSFVNTESGFQLIFTRLLQLAQAIPGVTEITRATVNGNGFDNTGGVYSTVGTGIENLTAGAAEFIRPSLADIVIS